jgi:hypothetical protein
MAPTPIILTGLNLTWVGLFPGLLVPSSSLNRLILGPPYNLVSVLLIILLLSTFTCVRVVICAKVVFSEGLSSLPLYPQAL